MENKKRNNNTNKPKRKAGSYKKASLLKPSGKKSSNNPHTKANDGKVRLNKFLANAGICSRREADTLISTGVVTVNGKIITEMGFKVDPENDKVTYGGETIRGEKKVYLLMNKPKDFITTVDDPFGRRTVMQLLGKLKQRVYPVGRLDRPTTGVLMLTNDGELTKKLTHPKYGVKKIYHVTLDKNVTDNHLKHLCDGFELEDGFTKADVAVHIGDGKKKREVGVELHSGKNRIIRRMFAHLGYEVVKLDRVSFAGLTKKNLARGQWRFLTEKEVNALKMMQS